MSQSAYGNENVPRLTPNRRLVISAEGMGFDGRTLPNSRLENAFHRNLKSPSELRQSGSTRLIPFDPVFGCLKQGENRVNFSLLAGKGNVLYTLLFFSLLGAVLAGGAAEDDRDIQPRPKRRRKRRREDRGLPSDEELAELARTYVFAAVLSESKVHEVFTTANHYLDQQSRDSLKDAL